MQTKDFLNQAEKYSAHNYHPLPVVLTKGQGVWVWDVEGKKYLDMLSSYSALNQGHCHPKIVAALQTQAEKLTLTSRAFHNDRMGPFMKKLCELSGFEKCLLMNSGAEAVETAIKAARRWGYLKKKAAKDKAEIICCSGNFHGRTTTIVGFSTEPSYQEGFGPFTPGFKIIPYNDVEALKKAITPNTVGFLVEPIQGEGGVIVPKQGYLQAAREITQKNNCLLICDEIQTGLGRCGALFVCKDEKIKPDILIVGKALAGGMYPVSGILADETVMDVFVPGIHGSTFGGNPLGCAAGMAALGVMVEEKLPQRAKELGEYFVDGLNKIKHPAIKEVRGRGLLIGVEVKKEYGSARPYCEKLMGLGILAKETHDQVIRFAPPLVIKKEEIDWALEKIKKLFT
ncbi:MAG: ornithine--oxo-acid transaminase [Deltaproteobacteria bacterium]|nr:ornithine--oxo-acid transaminase [Deltaproteobacteria bacterium]